MTALWQITDELVSIVAAALPDVAVFDGDPADGRPLAEAVWVAETETELEWRGLGGCRYEDLEITLHAAVYREAEEDQADAREAAKARLRHLVEQIDEVAIGGNQTLNGSCTDAKVTRIKGLYVKATDSWEAQAELTVTCKHLP